MPAEHNRKSLVDDSYQSVGAKKAKAKSGGGGNGLKVALIVVCLGAAGVLLAYNFGLIENPFAEKITQAPPTEEDNKIREDFQKQNEALKKSPKPPAIGGS